MDFTLTGFRQERDIRKFTFRGGNDDRTHSEFTVAADVSLLRKYGIALQELPLLCLRLLEQQTPISSPEVVIFTEELIREHADQCAALKRAAEQRKKPRKSPTGRLGEGWRNHPL